MAEHNDLGLAGEDAAAAALLRAGYRVLDRNWRGGGGELDIVAERGGVLAVVEVKTRATARYGRPEEAVTPRKARLLARAADAYVRAKAIDLPVRFDVVSVLATGETEHIEDAFRPAAGW